MSENYLVKLIADRVREFSPAEVIKLQDLAVQFYQLRDKQQLSSLLEAHAIYSGPLKEFVEISLAEFNGSDELVTDKRDGGVNELIYESLLPAFKPKTDEVTKVTRILPNSNLTYPEALSTSRAIFDYYNGMNFLVLPFIVPEQPNSIHGIVTSRLTAAPKDIRLVEVTHVKTKTSDYRLVNFLGGNPNPRGHKNLAPETYYSARFWLYKFEHVTSKQIYVLLSRNKIEPGYYNIRGCPIRLLDASSIGDKVQLPNDLWLYYVTNIEPDTRCIEGPEFYHRTRGLGHEELAQTIFGQLRHPLWFEKFILSWLFSAPFDGFPLHLSIISKPGRGKSHFLEALQITYNELPGIFNGSNSTFKDLVPSFGTALPKEGYLARVRRIGFVDEFFTCISKAASQGGLDSFDGLGELTTLLDCSVGAVGSGKHEPIEIRARGRVVFVGNPKVHLANMDDIADHLNNAGCSRILWYFMTPQHAEFIAARQAEVSAMPKNLQYPEASKFVELIDYMNSIHLKVDWRKTQPMMERCKEFCPIKAYQIYEARANHHINCLVDGVAKYNSIIDQRLELKIEEKDYVEAEALFNDVISTWMDRDNALQVPLKIRKNYVPIKTRMLLDTLEEAGSVKLEDLKNAHKDMIEDRTFNYHLANLERFSLGVLRGDKVYAYWHREVKDG